jgi:SAM-dependent methyltransferase
MLVKLSRRSESFAPSQRSIELIKEISRTIKPNDEALAGWFRDYASGQRNRLAFDLDYLSEFVKPSSTILEFGSTPLLLTGAARRLGYDICGVDLNPERFSNSARQLGVRVVQCDIETAPLPFADASFDVAIFNEIFEHLRLNLIHTFSQIFRVLRPGGSLLLSTPNLRSLEGITNFLLGDRPYGNSGDLYTEYEKLQKVGHMGHVREYTVIEVVEFLSRIGFSVRQIIHRGQYPQSWKRSLIRVVPSWRPYVSYIATR